MGWDTDPVYIRLLDLCVHNGVITADPNIWRPRIGILWYLVVNPYQLIMSDKSMVSNPAIDVLFAFEMNQALYSRYRECGYC